MSLDGLLSRLASDRVVVGIDVAKHGMFATVMDEAQKVHATLRWQHPDETRDFVAHLEDMRNIGASVQVAMEPSGVYGDALRFEIERAGFEVFRVSPKRSHDAAEVYDGVPSLHDAKSAAIVAKLHLDSASERWRSSPTRSESSTPLCGSRRCTRSSSSRTGIGSRRSPRGTGPS